MTLGQRIGECRRKLGISQEELGGRLGVSRQAVSKWENDASVPDMENLLALAREFGVPLAELTATPEPAPEKGTAVRPARRRRRRMAAALVLAVALAASALFWLRAGRGNEDGSPDQLPPPETEFCLSWQGPDGLEWFALGRQDGLFPFDTSLALTEPEEVTDTDCGGVTLHRADCGALTVEYTHTVPEDDPDQDPDLPAWETVTGLSTISEGYSLPNGIQVGSTKAEVLAVFGDALVYCLKEEGGYSLVYHDYYYAYQTAETGSASLCLFMADGLVAGIRLEDMGDLGSEAYAPDHVFRFPLADGEPDFSRRTEPEREPVSDTRRVYIAWNRLITDNNLSAEERYACRLDVFSLLPEVDWTEFRTLSGTYEQPDAGFFGIMSWLAEQEPYSDAEILWIQMGCAAPGLDGAYTDAYCHVLSQTLFFDPAAFVRALAADGVDGVILDQAVRFAAYDARLDPARLADAVEALDTALRDGSFTPAERDWAERLERCLTAPAGG